ncbi:MAG: hypothetical protein C0425_08900 [Chlorobiaceae bacterium]|nr:hypothetical protein [Chlorobiaceae bacterium]MBA4310440.1 hypothetical protein [Chlorobiaceae bacterium]
MINIQNYIKEKNFIKKIYTDFIHIGDSSKFKTKNLGENFTKLNVFFFEYINEYNIPNGYLEHIDKNSVKLSNHENFSFYIKINNVVNKNLAKTFSKKEYDTLYIPILETYISEQNNLINDNHIACFDLAPLADFKVMNRICTKLNVVLKSFFERRNLIFAELNCFFGKYQDKIFLIGDFSPLSLKVFDPSKLKDLNPYKLNSAQALKNYSDYLMDVIK